MGKRVAVVTGASSGLGVEFALQIDQGWELDEIWLVARREGALAEVGGRLTRATGVAIAADLSTPEGVQRVLGKLEEESPDLRLLVNNAGYGRMGRFDRLPIDSQLGMIDLNCRALAEMTHGGLGHMSEGAIVIQVASSAGFTPIPYFAIYAATKAFVIEFTVALGAELRERGIHALTVCPGPVRTEFHQVATSEEGGTTKVDEPKTAVGPEKVVARALHHARRKRWFSIFGAAMKMVPFVSRLTTRRFTARTVKWAQDRGLWL